MSASSPASKSTNVRQFDVEKAAHALRLRLAKAASYAKNASSLEGHKGDARSDSACSIASSSASPSPSHGSVPQELCIGIQGLGIGLSPTKEEGNAVENTTADGSAAGGNVQIISFAQRLAMANEDRCDRPPSLNDLLFKPLLQSTSADTLMAHEKDVKSVPSMDDPVYTRRSSHVRQGSSAFLEQVAMFSPHVAEADEFEMQPENELLLTRPMLNGSLAHSSRKSESLSTPNLTTFNNSPGLRWSDEINASVERLENANTTPKRRRRVDDSHAVTKLGVTPSQRDALSSPQMTVTPKRFIHNRRISLGAAHSLLSNGHPASSLAQDLGLANGGVRPSRSRHVSAAAGTFAMEEDAASQQQVHDPDLLAGMVLANLATASEDAKVSAKREEVAAQTTPRKTSTFVDPNIATPRKRHRSEHQSLHPYTPPSSTRSHLRFKGAESDDATNNEAAAHSLLDLAASPSPLRESTRSRFPGFTPSLQEGLHSARRHGPTTPTLQSVPEGHHQSLLRTPIKYRLMDDIDRHEAKGTVGRTSLANSQSPVNSRISFRSRVKGHSRTGSLGSHGLNDAGGPLARLPPSLLSTSLHPSTPPRAEHNRPDTITIQQSGGRIRLMSPPMTPPRSDEVNQRSKTEQGDRRGSLRSSSPQTPLSMKAAAHEGKDTSQRQDEKEDLQMAIVAKEKLSVPDSKGSDDDDSNPKTPLREERHLSEAIEEGLRTPPLVPHTPRTPKAPGSNFNYGDFLHVSPSPQPRMRTFSHARSATVGASISDDIRTLVGVDETPTRGTRGRARFLDFATAGKAEECNLTSRSPAKPSKEVFFHVGPLPASSKESGLKDAFEPIEKEGGSELGLALQVPSSMGARNVSLDELDQEEQVLVPGKRAAMVLQPSPSGGSKRKRGVAVAKSHRSSSPLPSALDEMVE